MDQDLLHILQSTIRSDLREKDCVRAPEGELFQMCKHASRKVLELEPSLKVEDIESPVFLRHITTYEDQAIYAGICLHCQKVHYWHRYARNYGDCPSGACAI
jgi:hypothetical protein